MIRCCGTRSQKQHDLLQDIVFQRRGHALEGSQSISKSHHSSRNPIIVELNPSFDDFLYLSGPNYELIAGCIPKFSEIWWTWPPSFSTMFTYSIAMWNGSFLKPNHPCYNRIFMMFPDKNQPANWGSPMTLEPPQNHHRGNEKMDLQCLWGRGAVTTRRLLAGSDRPGISAFCGVRDWLVLTLRC